MLNSTLALGLLATAAASAPPKLDLPAVIQRAQQQPVVEVARAAAREAHAKAVEASRSWFPQVEITVIGGPTNAIHCIPTAEECIQTNVSNASIGFGSIFGRVDGRLAMPVYTFGKISAGTRAAEAGAKAGDALAEQSEHGAVLDAAKAWLAVKLGRELIAMLNEGRGYIQEELTREDKALAEGSGEITEADHRRVLTFLAEIDARLSEARKVEEAGLAGLHYVWGSTQVDVDDAPLAPAVFVLPSREEARTLATRRPEYRAASSGLDAAAGLVELEEARWWPDFVVVGTGTLARSTNVDHPKNAFLSDPYNVTSGALGLALRWTLDAGTRSPKIEQAQAAKARAEATARMAREGLAAETERAWSDSRDARDRMKAARDGQRHARAWLASVLQSEAAGLAEPKDLADALLQYFAMRARLIQATFDWDLSVIAFQRAVGQRPEAPRFVEEE